MTHCSPFAMAQALLRLSKIPFLFGHEEVAKMAKEWNVTYSTLLTKAQKLPRFNHRRVKIYSEQVEAAYRAIKAGSTVADEAQKMYCSPAVLNNKVKAYQESLEAAKEVLKQDAVLAPISPTWVPSGFIRQLSRKELCQGKARPARSRLSDGSEGTKV